MVRPLEDYFQVDSPVMLPEELLKQCECHDEVGSRITCNPPPNDTDRDVLCLVSNVKRFVVTALAGGWEAGGSLEDMVDDFASRAESSITFVSFRSGINNFIVTGSPEFYRKFMLATSLAKKFNLMDKQDRIALFQAILYAKEYPVL